MTDLEPGPKMDEAVAAAIDWKPSEITRDFNGNPWPVGTPRFSTDDADALRFLVPWLNAQGYRVEATWYDDGDVTARVTDDPLMSAIAATGSLAEQLSRLALAVAARNAGREGE